MTDNRRDFDRNLRSGHKNEKRRSERTSDSDRKRGGYNNKYSESNHDSPPNRKGAEQHEEFMPFERKTRPDRKRSAQKGKYVPYERNARSEQKRSEHKSDYKPYDRNIRPERKRPEQKDDYVPYNRKPRQDKNPFGQRSEHVPYERNARSGQERSEHKTDYKPYDKNIRPERKRTEQKDDYVPYDRKPRQDKNPFGRRGEHVPFDKNARKPYPKKYQSKRYEEEEIVEEPKDVRLNKFIANTGYCSRREADEVIRSGVVTVNGETVTELGVRVKPEDEVLINGAKSVSQKKVYILLNKPKDCITTKKDPQGRKTVYEHIAGACKQSVEAVGRLDRNTTGVLLFTNDGDLAQKLIHPKHEKMKIYHAYLEKPLSLPDFEKITAGVDVDGEKIIPDDLQYVSGDKYEIGIQIHSGKYHIVKRIFESVGYRVQKLDRVYFAGLTKKNLPRGKWRFLTEKEVTILKQGAYE
ncbi:MAG: pseudouridine synthase [Bacteroidota bacterium]